MMRTRYAMPNTRALMGLGGGMSEQDAYDREMDRLTRMDVARSTIGVNDARAESERGKLALDQQMQAAALEARRARADADTQQRMLLLRDPTIPPEAARAHVRRAEGGPFAAPQYANPDQARLAGETLAGIFATSLADKETGGKDLADVVFDAGSSAQRLRAPEVAASDPVTAAFMLNAGTGKDAPALYGAMPGGLGTFGTLTGKMNINQPLQQSVIGENNAQAGSHWASAGASNALAAQRRDQTGAPTIDAGRGLVISRDGTARQITVDGQPIGEKKSSLVSVNGGGRPLTATELRLQQENIDAINLASNMDIDLAQFERQIEAGELPLGRLDNIESEARNWWGSGATTPGSRNYASFRAMLEKARNDSLRLNKGVQTEGDAVRAWNELIANISDPELVKQRLAEIRVINQRAADERQMMIDLIRQNKGLDALDVRALVQPRPAFGQAKAPEAAPRPGGATGTWGEQPAPSAPPLRLDVNGVGGTTGEAAVNEGLPQVMTDEDYAALPPGARYIDPDGNERRKPQ